MGFKIDTKANYRVLSASDPVLNANLAAELVKTLEQDPPNSATSLIFDLSLVSDADEPSIKAILTVYLSIYANNASCVLAGLQPSLQKKFLDLSLDQDLNFTPTIAEGVDIVMMEQMERAFYGQEES